MSGLRQTITMKSEIRRVLTRTLGAMLLVFSSLQTLAFAQGGGGPLLNATLVPGPFHIAGVTYPSAQAFLQALIQVPPNFYLPAPPTVPPGVGLPGDNRGTRYGFIFLDRPALPDPLGDLTILTKGLMR